MYKETRGRAYPVDKTLTISAVSIDKRCFAK